MSVREEKDKTTKVPNLGREVLPTALPFDSCRNL
jgi:hypothetical protein